MLHVVQFSGGKDSTAMLLMMLEKQMPVDYIIFCDTGMEFPEMYEHIQKVDKYIRVKYGKHVTTIKPNHSFEHYMFDHERTSGEFKGLKGYSWSNMRLRWCTKELKIRPTDNFLKQLGQPYTLYIGIAYDEPKRHENIADNIIHPLFDWRLTEQECLQYCYDKGFNWGGCYTKFTRTSCWCCPLQSIRDLRQLYYHYPDLWKRLKELDNKAYSNFKIKYSVQNYEDRFKIEEQIGIQKRFPWKKYNITPPPSKDGICKKHTKTNIKGANY